MRLPQIWRSGCSLVLLCISCAAYGQSGGEPPKDTVHYRKPDSLRVKIYPRAIRFSTDLLSIIRSQTIATFKGWEVNADMDLGRYYLAADYGSWERNYNLKTGGTYSNGGTYWRAGIDVNLLMKDPDRNMFFLGFRYGRSQFHESTTVITNDVVFGTIQQDLVNPSVSAGWGEIVTGLRVKMWKNFWLGYTARMKFAPGVQGDTAVKAYDIPGYGLNGKGVTWGFNYQVMWRIPFGKEKKAKSRPAPGATN